MIPVPEELLEQVERGNVLLFIGERITRDVEEQAIVDRLAAQLAARCTIADAGGLPFPEAAQAYEDEKGQQALMQFLRDQLEELGDEPQQAHRLIAGLTDCLDRRLERAFEEVGRPLDVVIGAVSTAFSGFSDSKGIEPLRPLRSADDTERVMLSADSTAFSGFSGFSDSTEGRAIPPRPDRHPRARRTPGADSALPAPRSVAGQRCATVRAVSRTGHRRQGS